MTIKVYSTPTCPWCVKAKDYFKAKNLSFLDVDVASNHEEAREMVQKSGQRGVPVIEIDGNIVVGFDQMKIEKLLNI